MFYSYCVLDIDAALKDSFKSVVSALKVLEEALSIACWLGDFLIENLERCTLISRGYESVLLGQRLWSHCFNECEKVAPIKELLRTQ